MNPILEILVREVVLPAVLLGATTLGGWLITRLPGPLRDWLTSGTHARDVAVLVQTMARRAVAEVANPATPRPTAAEVIDYTARVRGDLLAKMNVSPEALETMANAAIAAAATPPR